MVGGWGVRGHRVMGCDGCEWVMGDGVMGVWVCGCGCEGIRGGWCVCVCVGMGGLGESWMVCVGCGLSGEVAPHAETCKIAACWFWAPFWFAGDIYIPVPIWSWVAECIGACHVL